MKTPRLHLAALAIVTLAASAQAEIQVTAEHSAHNTGFTFKSTPAPANNDAATGARFTLVDGASDPNSGDLAILNDGRTPTEEDQPRANFFYRAGTHGGRLQLDLGRTISIQRISSYSWHGGTRAAQVYQAYAADGTAPDFNPTPTRRTDPTTCGWRLIAKVDTRAPDHADGGQHGVAITESSGSIGRYRYLLFDIAPTEDRDAFGNTFFNEIDIIDASGPALTTSVVKPILQTFDTADGQCHVTIDITHAPDLAHWTEHDLQPVVQQWYPQIVALLPSGSYTAPQAIALRFRSDMGNTPAAATGAGVSLNTAWFRRELKGQARGAVVHELVHIVQSYRNAQRNPQATATPGWIVEGIADYVRWYLYEPQSKGAEITRFNLAAAKYDASYRISANFLNWGVQTYDKDLIRKLNAAAREGKYAEALWQQWTGKPLQQLGTEWQQHLGK